MTISDNVALVKEQLALAARKAGRDPSDIILLAASKMNDAARVREAVAAARAYAPFVRKVEVEVETLDMVREAVAAGADIIMLDNMDHDTMAEAIAIIDGAAEVEVSGNVDAQNAAALVDLGVDIVSSGALTHSAPILDLSLKHLTVTGREGQE